MSCVTEEGRKGRVSSSTASWASPRGSQQRLAYIGVPTDPEGRHAERNHSAECATHVLCLYFLAAVSEVQRAGYRKLKSFLHCNLFLMPLCPMK